MCLQSACVVATCPREFRPLLHAISNGDVGVVTRTIMQLDSLREEVIRMTMDQLERECHLLCRKKEFCSILRKIGRNVGLYV